MKESKEHILKIAFNLFLQKNFKEVTMKEIVEKTGLSKGAFYHYFTSKEQLFSEVNDYYFAIMAKVDYENFSKASLTQFYRDYLDHAARLFQTFFNVEMGEKENFTFNYFTMVFDALKRFPEFREKMIAHDRRELETWTGAVSRARATGEIRSAMNDEQIAKVFLCTSDGVAVRLIMENRLSDLRFELLGLWDNFYAQLAVKEVEPVVQ